ncbi:MAG: peptidylprolyl isomerase [Acidimicrobiia bacterium]|nr:peptidylprolyl isomerase [Acidimicrobiia bacterium]
MSSYRFLAPLAAAAIFVLSSCSSGTPPNQYKVKLETTKGDIVIEVNRDWSPLGADRFHELVTSGYYDANRFFRVLPRFVVQFGLHGDPSVNNKWSDARLQDDPPSQSNVAGTVTFATAGPNTRTTQVFINLMDNRQLDAMGFTPFGRIVEGMNVVNELFSGYGEGAPAGPGPDQQRIKAEGNAYLQQVFPNLDYIKKASVL